MGPGQAALALRTSWRGLARREAMKRAREGEVGSGRVVVDAGGVKITTTVTTIERSSYLFGMIDTSVWEGDPKHTLELFVDRDPEVFSQLLRLMRQAPHVAGLIPTEPRACASLIAEADFFGYEPALNHIKVRSYYNSRIADDDHPAYRKPERQPNQGLAAFRTYINLAFRQHRKELDRISECFQKRDEAYALAKFDSVYGSIADALEAGVLPTSYLARTTIPKPSSKIVQLLPVDSPTWFLIGDCYDKRCMRDPRLDDYIPMVKMTRVVTQPALVRRVACHALLEDEREHRWMEPMIHLSAADQDMCETSGIQP